MAQQPQLQFPKGILPIVFIGIIVLIFISKSTVTIDAGEAGVLWKRFGGGVVTDELPLGEGFHLVAPWNTVIVYETRQQELTEKMKVLSSNGLDIQLDASVLYQPDLNNLSRLHKEKGQNYLKRVLLPAIRSAARSANTRPRMVMVG